MRKKLVVFMALLAELMTFVVHTAYAADITSYAFADVAGNIDGDTITVHVPNSTKTTYWNHKVGVTEGASFTTSNIREISSNQSQGEITVRDKDGSAHTYTVYLIKDEYITPEYSISKAKSVKKDSAKVTVTLKSNDATINKMRLAYYTGKNQVSYKECKKDVESQDIELSGLKAGTRYHYYLEVEAGDKVYTTASKTFSTKAAASSGTSSATTKTSSTSSNNKVIEQGTNESVKVQSSSHKEEWVEENNTWVYYGKDGYSKVGWFQVGDEWYYFDRESNKLIVNQWKEINDVPYYFGVSGAMAKNEWVKSGDIWYYAGDSGTLVQSDFISLGGITYALAPDGSCLSNKWIRRNGRWQYCKPNSAGIACNEDFAYEGKLYHADTDGFIS